MVPRLLGLKLDPDDLRIISLLYFRGVQRVGAVRVALRISPVTFFLRMKRLRRLGVVECSAGALDADARNLNLCLPVRQRLFDLEMDIRAAGLFEGSLAGDGTITSQVQLSVTHGVYPARKCRGGAMRIGAQWVS